MKAGDKCFSKYFFCSPPMKKEESECVFVIERESVGGWEGVCTLLGCMYRIKKMRVCFCDRKRVCLSVGGCMYHTHWMCHVLCSFDRETHMNTHMNTHMDTHMNTHMNMYHTHWMHHDDVMYVLMM